MDWDLCSFTDLKFSLGEGGAGGGGNLDILVLCRPAWTRLGGLETNYSFWTSFKTVTVVREV